MLKSDIVAIKYHSILLKCWYYNIFILWTIHKNTCILHYCKQRMSCGILEAAVGNFSSVQKRATNIVIPRDGTISERGYLARYQTAVQQYYLVFQQYLR